MEKYKRIAKLCLAVLITPFFLSSCSDDDSGSDGVSFITIASGWDEADGAGSLQIPVDFDGDASDIEFSYSGTATLDEDFEVVGFADGILTLNIIDDDAAENLETIRVTIVSVSGGTGGNPIHTVTLLSDDPGYMTIELQWEDAVDLDLISWYFNEETQEWEDIDFSDPGNTLDPIDWKDPDGLYGFTYNYYAGADDSVPFTVVFTPTGVTLEGGTDPLEFNATYTLDNVDPVNVQIEQVVTKSGTAFTDFSDIEVPEEGSRKSEVLAKLKKAAADLHTRKGE